jgi:hypothetical protein
MPPKSQVQRKSLATRSEPGVCEQHDVLLLDARRLIAGATDHERRYAHELFLPRKRSNGVHGSWLPSTWTLVPPPRPGAREAGVSSFHQREKLRQLSAACATTAQLATLFLSQGNTLPRTHHSPQGRW